MVAMMMVMVMVMVMVPVIIVSVTVAIVHRRGLAALLTGSGLEGVKRG